MQVVKYRHYNSFISRWASFLEADWYRLEENFIVLLNEIMPGMDGLEVLARLRNEYNNDSLIVSMMTARTSESDIKAALRLGAEDYINETI